MFTQYRKYIWVVGTVGLIFKICVNQLKILVSWQLEENYLWRFFFFNFWMYHLGKLI
jgi:hypothetical protein